MPGPSKSQPSSMARVGNDTLVDAEALLRSGRIRESIALANNRTTDVELELGNDLDSVVGRALFELGEVKDAISVLRRVLTNSQNLSPRAQFTAALNLFSRESQFQSPDEALPLLSTLRQLSAPWRQGMATLFATIRCANAAPNMGSRRFMRCRRRYRNWSG